MWGENHREGNVWPKGEIVVILTLHFDGFCMPNPGGIASYGVVIDGTSRKCLNEVIGEGPDTSNNIAEWTGLLKGLRWLKANRPPDLASLEIYGDSQLVIKQLTQEWKIKAKHLRPLRDECWSILGSLDTTWSADWIPREQNWEADELAELAVVAYRRDKRAAVV